MGLLPVYLWHEVGRPSRSGTRECNGNLMMGVVSDASWCAQAQLLLQGASCSSGADGADGEALRLQLPRQLQPAGAASLVRVVLLPQVCPCYSRSAPDAMTVSFQADLLQVYCAPCCEKAPVTISDAVGGPCTAVHCASLTKAHHARQVQPGMRVVYGPSCSYDMYVLGHSACHDLLPLCAYLSTWQ